MDLVVTVNGCETTCLVDSGATHNFICTNLLYTASLWASIDEPLEVVLANGKEVETNQVCKFLSTLVKEYTKSLNVKLFKN